jgi:hypothetical protein
MSRYIPVLSVGQECDYERHTTVVPKKSRVWKG